jgi:hypothetical protein
MPTSKHENAQRNRVCYLMEDSPCPAKSPPPRQMGSSRLPTAGAQPTPGEHVCLDGPPRRFQAERATCSSLAAWRALRAALASCLGEKTCKTLRCSTTRCPNFSTRCSHVVNILSTVRHIMSTCCQRFAHIMSTACLQLVHNSYDPHIVHILSNVCPQLVHILSTSCPHFVHGVSTSYLIHILSTSCPRFVHILSTSCPHLVHGLSTSCPQLVHILSTVCPHLRSSTYCPHLVHGLSTSCPHLVHILSTSCPRRVHGLSTTCPHIVHILSTSCPQLVHILSKFTNRSHRMA